MIKESLCGGGGVGGGMVHIDSLASSAKKFSGLITGRTTQSFHTAATYVQYQPASPDTAITPLQQRESFFFFCARIFLRNEGGTETRMRGVGRGGTCIHTAITEAQLSLRAAFSCEFAKVLEKTVKTAPWISLPPLFCSLSKKNKSPNHVVN